MVEVSFYAHPLAPAQKAHPENFALWLLENVGESPSGRVSIYQGEPSAETLITEPAQIIRAQGQIAVVLEPGADPFSWAAVSKFLISAAISTALSFVIGYLTRPSSSQSARNRTQSSPNNSLGERDNQVRILERVEDIYGQVLSVPSLMMPTYRKYVAHRQVEYGYYCVGRGYYNITELKDGDTLVENFTGASAAIYDPFTAPGFGAPRQQIGPAISDRIQMVSRSPQVDGVVLKALNQLQIVGKQKFELQSPRTMVQPEGTNPSFSEIAEPGMSATVSIDAQTIQGQELDVQTAVDKVDALFIIPMSIGTQFQLRWGAGTPLTGVFEIIGKQSATTAIVANISGSNLTDGVFNVAYEYTQPPITFTDVIESVGDRSITFETQTFINNPAVMATVNIDNGNQDAWTDWFTMNAPTARQAWANVVAAQGMYKEDQNDRRATTVAYQMQVQSTADGSVYTVNSSISGATQDERAETLEYSLPFTGSFRMRLRRTTSFDFNFEGVVIDEIRWTDMYAVSPVNKNEFGNKTTIHTVTPATARATASRQRQLNCKAFRLLPEFDGTNWSAVMAPDGRIASGTLRPTSRAINVMASMLQDPRIGGRPLSDMDVRQVWLTQAAIEQWNPVCAEFNYTFDSTDMSLEDMLGTVANAVFCTAYRQNGKIRLFFERAQSQPVGMFSHRNKRPDSETVTRSFNNDSDYDGVEISYRDRESTQSEVIRLPLDGSAIRYKKIDLLGVVDFTAAWYRACREHAKLFNQREVIETEVTGDGRLVTPGALVNIVDNTRFKSYDGEILAQSGLRLTLSQPVVLGVSPTIMLKRRNGSVESIPVTAGAHSREVVLARPPAEQIVTDVSPMEGLRTEFSVASNDRRAAQRYLVQEVARSDGEYVKITAVNYAAEYYAADSQPVPSRGSVINAN